MEATANTHDDAQGSRGAAKLAFMLNSTDQAASIGIALSTVTILLGYLCISMTLLMVGSAGLLSSAIVLAVGEERQFQPAILLAFVTFCALRMHMAEFPFVVGDAASYTQDGIRFVERGVNSGFFPPFSSALSAIGYRIFGIADIAAPNILVAFLASFMIYRIGIQFFETKFIAIMICVINSIQPLQIWFSKTTFSESGWILIWINMALLICVMRYSTSKLLTIIAFSTLSFVLNFSRGSAPFIYLPMIGAALLIGELSSRQKLALWLCSAAAFVAGLLWVSEIRTVYIIGWQYSKVYDGLTPHRLAVLGALSAFILPGVLLFLLNFLRRSHVFAIFVIALILFKVVAAILLSPDQSSIGHVLLINEILMAHANFGWLGVLFIGLGLIAMIRRAFTGDLIALVLLAVYCGASAPFALQNAVPGKIHDVPMYWSRYYLSEIFIVHLFAFGLSMQYLYLKMSIIFNKIERQFVCAMSLLLIINFPAMAYAIGYSYMKGSADVYKFLMDVSAEKNTAIFGLKSNKIYSEYNSLKMIETLPSERPVSLHDFNTDAALLDRLPSGSRVVCINIPQCDLNPRLVRLGSISRVIGWDIQSGPYTNLTPKRKFWSVVAYDVKG